MNERDLQTMRDLIFAGALGGTGLGIIKNIRRHNKLLNQQADSAEMLEDPEILQAAKTASEFAKLAKNMNWLTGGAGLAGGLGAGIGGFSLMDKMYQKLRREELEKMLGNSEEAYTAAILAEHEANKLNKSASPRLPNLLDELAPVALVGSIPLAAIASGIFTNRMLERNFGPQPGDGGIPKLKLTDLPAIMAQEEDDPDAQEGKIASYLSNGEEALCHVLGTVCAMVKAADVRDFVKAVALGRGAELEKVAKEQGMETAMLLTKGASSHPISGQAFAMALVRTVKTAAWRPVISLLVAAEMQEHCPGQIKIASFMDEKTQQNYMLTLVHQAKLARAMVFGALEGEPSGEVDLSKVNIKEAIDSFCKSAEKPGYGTADQVTPSADSLPQEDGETGTEDMEDKDLIDQALSQVQTDGDGSEQVAAAV